MRIKAHAKINLSLEVLGRRDDGYHEIITILQTVDLADVLYFQPSTRLSLDCSNPNLSGKDNIAFQAAVALRQATGICYGAKIRIEKNIPEAMGLGGGSSDAAATLVALNYLWELNLSVTDLGRIGRGIGSDVPFFVKGGTAIGQGRGDIVTWLGSQDRRWIVLVCPMIENHNKTARMYSILTENWYSDGQFTSDLRGALGNGRICNDMLFNVFTNVAVQRYPTLNNIIKDMVTSGADLVHLSGTGPALFTMLSSLNKARALWCALKNMGYRVYLLRTTDRISHFTHPFPSNWPNVQEA